jgi:hypothetical protein
MSKNKLNIKYEMCHKKGHRIGNLEVIKLVLDVIRALSPSKCGSLGAETTDTISCVHT